MKIKNLFKKETLVNFFWTMVHLIKNLPGYFKFFILLFIFLIQKSTVPLKKIPLIGKYINLFLEKTVKPIEAIISKLDSNHIALTKRSFLINLAYKNLMVKKSRTLITITGMSVGIGVIVFLISLGYGIERLIIGQIATLDETMMIDVSTGENTSVKLDKKIYDQVKKMKNVKDTTPLISVVGKLNYNKATTDVIVYSVPKKFFDVSRQKIIKGKYYNDNTVFEDDNLGSNTDKEEVAGASTKLNTAVDYLTPVDNNQIYFNILPEERADIWENCDIKSNFLGYAIRLENGYRGIEYYGSSFYPFSENGLVGIDKKEGSSVGLWLKGNFPLFQKSLVAQDDILTPILDNDGKQVWQEGCIPKYKVKVEKKINLGEVLSESTGNAKLTTQNSTGEQDTATDSASLFNAVTVVASSEDGIEIVNLQATGSAQTKKQTLDFKGLVSGEAVVSLGLLNLLNIPVDKGLKTSFDLSLIVMKNLIPDIEGKATTTPAKYKVIGVIDDDSGAYLYIPFSDLNKLAVRNFSQMKILLTNKNDFNNVRKEIETMGYKTSSVVDTIKQITSLFTNVRFVLSIVGLVALVIAALGMFNTLTISLLERTREIGGMKVMGVISREVEDLFLAEAMILGLGGGFGGLALGFLSGKILSIIISMIAFSSQKQFLDLTYIPTSFILFIIFLSFFVGIFTGLYPAQRAKKISALNALRYE